MTPEEEKRNKKYERLGFGAVVVLFGLSAYMVFGVIVPRGIEEDKQKAKQSVIDNKANQYEQTLPYYKEYLQTQELIKQYRDSLQRTMK